MTYSIFPVLKISVLHNLRLRRSWVSYGMTVLLALALSKTAWSQQQTLTRVPGEPGAPTFSLLDVDGTRHNLADYAGKVVIVNFWATWCPPCREEMPSMQRAWHKLKDKGVVFLAINVGEDEDIIFEFTANYPADYPLLLDRDSSVIQSWPVKGLPTTFVVDPEGRLVYRAIGSRDWDHPDLMDQILKLGKKQASAVSR